MKGLFKPLHPSKYKGNPTQIVYRSSYELKLMDWCDRNRDVLEWSSEELAIAYVSPVDKRVHRYFPDFKIKRRKKDGTIETVIVEVKPKHQTVPPVQKGTKMTQSFKNAIMTYAINKAKWDACIEYCLDRNYKFQLITEDHLFGTK